MFSPPFIDSLMTDSALPESEDCVVFRVTVYLTQGSSHVLIGSPFLDIIPSMTAILLEYIDLSFPIPTKTVIAFPRYFSQQENLGIPEESNQWTHF